ncbi:MAG: hypothetical protein HOO88_06600 [Kiritimatiellaceae bacterium]|nr:hypothetical protein [Kiritimatiellaceae bacterium]
MNECDEGVASTFYNVEAASLPLARGKDASSTLKLLIGKSRLYSAFGSAKVGADRKA